jgi:hypothetical protein
VDVQNDPALEGFPVIIIIIIKKKKKKREGGGLTLNIDQII